MSRAPRSAGPRRRAGRRALLWWFTAAVALVSGPGALALERGLRAAGVHWILDLQGSAYDRGMTRYAVGGRGAAEAGPVTVVRITTETRRRLQSHDRVLPELAGRRLTWRLHQRAFHARLVRNLQALGARVIVFDLLFDEPDPMDRYLAAALRAHGRTVLAAVDDSGVELGGQGERVHSLVYPTADLREAARAIGFANLLTDPDQTIRRFEWWTDGWDEETLEDTRFPLLGVAAAELCSGRSPRSALEEEFVTTGAFLGHRVPYIAYRSGDDRERRSSFVRYFGAADAPAGPGSSVEYADVFFSSDPEDPSHDAAIRPLLRRAIAGRVVLIGSTSGVEQDIHRVPVVSSGFLLADRQQMPGVEIQAHIVQTVLSGRYPYRAPGWSHTAMVLVLAVAVAVAGRITPPIALGPLAIALVFLTFTASIRLLSERGVWLEPVTASTGVVIAALLQSSAMYFGERKGRLQVARQLRRHVGPGADRLAEGDLPDFGGEQQPITLLFSDLEGFTRASEKMSAREVVAFLDRYCEVVFPVFDRHGAAVDKLMGDGVMVYFNWPHPQPDHAARAVRCALELRERLAEWARREQDAGGPALRTRIGIHTGEAVIGEIGYGRRAELTVIGDVVNVASRLEQMNKELGTDILVSRETRDAVPDVPMMPCGSIEVRGRRDPIEVFCPESADSAPPAKSG